MDFLPVTGRRYLSYLDLLQSKGNYWSSTLSKNARNAWVLGFDSDYFATNGSLERYYGVAIRPVSE